MSTQREGAGADEGFVGTCSSRGDGEAGGWTAWETMRHCGAGRRGVSETARRERRGSGRVGERKAAVDIAGVAGEGGVGGGGCRCGRGQKQG